MSRSIVKISVSKSPVDAARLMIRNDIGRIPVVDGDEMIGIVTRTDVMCYFYDFG